MTISGYRAGTARRRPTSDEDVATNIADFVKNPSIYTGFAAYAAGPIWIVNVVDGDYYSVHAVAQVNFLSDNDVATQVSSSSHYNLVGGDNEQGNLSLIFDGDIRIRPYHYQGQLSRPERDLSKQHLVGQRQDQDGG